MVIINLVKFLRFYKFLEKDIFSFQYVVVNIVQHYILNEFFDKITFL